MLYPIFYKLENRLVVLVGGGKLAIEKLTGLQHTRARILVISPEIHPHALELCLQLKGIWLKESFNGSFPDETTLVIAATDDPVVNEQVYKEARRSKIPVNVADQPDLCDWYNGAVIHRGSFTLALSSGGESPSLLKWLRVELDQQIPRDEAVFLDALKSIRKQMKEWGWSPAQRADWFTARFNELKMTEWVHE